jgi:hypothetical protein
MSAPLVAVVAAILATPLVASAQNWSFDARRIALGGALSGGNIASQLIEEEHDYRAIVLPIGLFQVLRTLDIFKPDSPEFDLVRSVEYAASPLHYVIGRDETGTGANFVTDIRNGRLNRDLNAYRGFVPVSQPEAEGLSNPSVGGTIKLWRGRGGAFEGIYIGAGPYLAMRDGVTIDPRLTAILGSSTPMYVPSTQLGIGSQMRGEGALAITGGYRARAVGLRGGSRRDGIYIAANYHYLRGLRYERGDIALRFDTDRNGLLTLDSAAGTPLAIARDTSTSGNGFAIDLGAAVVANGWEFGFGANGIANRITWTDVERTTYSLPNVFAGSGTFIETPAQPGPDERVELPVDYRGNVGYRSTHWAAVVEAGHGFQGGSFHGGAEYRGAGFAVRGGGLYTREEWHPTGGIGVPLGRRVALDAALFTTTANIERKRHAAVALSLRIGRT